MNDKTRLIEVAFPLKQASLDSVNEKNVRHGHISTLHIWPARRPLAACRAALIATLLPDPGTPEKRAELIEKIGGRVIEKIERKKMPSGKIKEIVKEETVGGILHWGRDTENKETLDWFRAEIKKAYGGRAPKVLDPFAGGGSIPLEAMRLGCEVTAIDINPVAWFILKCTLEYPQKLAGQKQPLPDFILKDRDFMEAFFKSQGLNGVTLRTQLEKVGFGEDENKAGRQKTFDVGMAKVPLDAGLAWHVRAWGKWVLAKARKDLAKFYPTYADFEPLKPGKKYDPQPMKLVPMKGDGTGDIDALNAEFDDTHLENKQNARWVAKPTVAYLWARTVKCKNCRATIPLLKTRWLCRKPKKRILLTMTPNERKTAVFHGIQRDVPLHGGNAAQRREHDRKLSRATMSRAGAWCPCCGQPGTVAMQMESIRQDGLAGRIGTTMVAVVIDGTHGKEYRIPTREEADLDCEALNELPDAFRDVPFGIPEERTPAGGGRGAGRAFSVHGYGATQWRDLFTARQLLASAKFVNHIRRAHDMMSDAEYPKDWADAMLCYTTSTFDKLIDHSSAVCSWNVQNEQVRQVFTRFALPFNLDFVEVVTTAERCGAFLSMLDSTFAAVSTLERIVPHGLNSPHIHAQSAIAHASEARYDVILTDPPYYDAIPYSDLMDFFYIWVRRILHDRLSGSERLFLNDLGPKWDHDNRDGELVDDESRHGGDRAASRTAYEDGMLRSFAACRDALQANGRLVVVFANKNPDAWETLVAAVIRAGFVVDGSWPIQTERAARTRSLSSAALASSVWLVCKKRSEAARPGWDNRVINEMREQVGTMLHEYWDAGIRGPDFVWAATGPAMEAYSKHPVVKKANDPGKLMEVSEFLRHVRRIVVDFVVGRVLSHNGEAESVSGLDDITTYYLLHRHDFKMEDAPIGACILYAISCGLSDKDLADRHDILARTGKKGASAEDDGETASEDEDTGKGGGSTVKLKTWKQRTRSGMGYDPAWDSAKARQNHERETPKLFDDDESAMQTQHEVPLIDQVHRLIHLWKAGDVSKVDSYLDTRGLRRSQLFAQVLQALIELAEQGSEERSLMESISNHLRASGMAPVSLFDGQGQGAED